MPWRVNTTYTNIKKPAVRAAGFFYQIGSIETIVVVKHW